MTRANLMFTATPRLTLSAAYGQYAQFPDFTRLLDVFGGRALKAERSNHVVFGAEHRTSEATRIRIEVYSQQERNRIFAEQTEFRLSGTATTQGLALSPSFYEIGPG